MHILCLFSTSTSAPGFALATLFALLRSPKRFRNCSIPPLSAVALSEGGAVAEKASGSSRKCLAANSLWEELPRNRPSPGNCRLSSNRSTDMIKLCVSSEKREPLLKQGLGGKGHEITITNLRNNRSKYVPYRYAVIY
jgi:hypothetical protein